MATKISVASPSFEWRRSENAGVAKWLTALGIKQRDAERRKSPSAGVTQILVAVRRIIGIAIVLTVVALEVNRFVSLSLLWEGPQRCRIKGNISLSGERIYHVPGGRWYDRTRIDTLKGERWFCSEDEARAAGWRKSRQ